jgi:uncharacterized protein (UPF0210 family)
MLSYIRRLVRWSVLFSFVCVGAVHAQDYTRPRIRAITGFVRIDRAHFAQDVGETLTVLRQAKEEFRKQGYEVETIRIVTQPLAELVGGLSDADALAFLKSFDQLSAKDEFSANVGPAMLRDTDDPHTMRLLAEALAALPHLQASAIIAGDDGIHWKVIHETAALVRYVADHGALAEDGRTGDLNFTATAMMKPYGPFFPGAYHLGPGKQFSMGFVGSNVVQEVFSRTHGEFGASVAELTKQLTVHAKVAERVGQKVAASSGWSFMGVDPTPAPRPNMSIATAIERYTGAPFGSSGTMTAALVITTAVKAVPVQQIGYSGLMLPVMEDSQLSLRWSQGAINIDNLLAYSAVCGTGLDTIPLPGDVSVEQLARIYGDVASLAWKWNKPLSARLLPFKNLKAGDHTHLVSQGLSNTTIQPAP